MRTLSSLLILASLTVGSAFMAPLSRSDRSLRLYAEPEAGKKINTKIDLESPKVVNTVELAAGEKKVFCRCWLSGTFPLCDGTHQKHNTATGDNVGPLIVSTAK